MTPVIEKGIDLFDCITPTHYARHGIAFTASGKLDLNKAAFLREHTALDASCACIACASYSRAYIAHLVRAKEITGMHLLTIHNLHFWNAFVARLREKIARDEM